MEASERCWRQRSSLAGQEGHRHRCFRRERCFHRRRPDRNHGENRLVPQVHLLDKSRDNLNYSIDETSEQNFKGSNILYSPPRVSVDIWAFPDDWKKSVKRTRGPLMGRFDLSPTSEAASSDDEETVSRDFVDFPVNKFVIHYHRLNDSSPIKSYI